VRMGVIVEVASPLRKIVSKKSVGGSHEDNELPLVKPCCVTNDLKQGAFVIRKFYSAFLVSVVESLVIIKPLYGSEHVASSIVTAGTMQMVGNSKLLLYKPEDPCEYLMEYYKGLGWAIEIAD
jgi:hypothetical protein